jgi:hypothetical protein
LGACAPIGWVTNINAYSIPSTEIANTIARHTPINTIKRAFNCSFVSLRCGLIIDTLSKYVLSTDSLSFALRCIALRRFPVFIELAVISCPSLVSLARG